MHWLRRCISTLVLAGAAGLALSASMAVSTETSQTSLAEVISIEDSIPALLPDPAQYDSALEYAMSEERADFLDGVATHVGIVIAHALENGDFGKTKRSDNDGETFSHRSKYTGIGTLSTPGDEIWVEADFADGKIDLTSVQWLKISDGHGQAALLHAPSKDGYWEVSYAANPEGAVGLTSTSLIVTAEGSTTQEARELDKNALVGIIQMMDEELPGWRDQR